MKCYVVYADWGDYEGCEAPIVAFTCKKDAAAWAFLCDSYDRDNLKIAEIDLDPSTTPQEPPNDNA